MIRFSNPFKNIAYTIYRWLIPIIDPIKIIKNIPAYSRYLFQMLQYASMNGSEKISLIHTAPYLEDSISITPFIRHYFYQDIWAFKNIYHSKVTHHIDIASRIDLIGFLTAITHVTFIDIRPLLADLDNYTSISGSILQIPLETNSVQSLSCLHVAEHIGLGRYGDELDPYGTLKSCSELSRVLAPGGFLYFSLPVGKPRVCFNAHRIHSPEQILNYFRNLQLVSLSGIDDDNTYHEHISIEQLSSMNYGCGLFVFTKVK